MFAPVKQHRGFCRYFVIKSEFQLQSVWWRGVMVTVVWVVRAHAFVVYTLLQCTTRLKSKWHNVMQMVGTVIVVCALVDFVQCAQSVVLRTFMCPCANVTLIRKGMLLFHLGKMWYVIFKAGHLLFLDDQEVCDVNVNSLWVGMGGWLERHAMLQFIFVWISFMNWSRCFTSRNYEQNSQM